MARFDETVLHPVTKKQGQNVVHIGGKIERIRRLRGMTQTQLGGSLGVSKQAISKMEQTEQLDDEG